MSTNGHAQKALALVEIDLGADRDMRPHACTKRTWCIESADHDGSCVEVPRRGHPPPNFGPKANR